MKSGIRIRLGHEVADKEMWGKTCRLGVLGASFVRSCLGHNLQRIIVRFPNTPLLPPIHRSVTPSPLTGTRLARGSRTSLCSLPYEPSPGSSSGSFGLPLPFAISSFSTIPQPQPHLSLRLSLSVPWRHRIIHLHLYCITLALTPFLVFVCLGSSYCVMLCHVYHLSCNGMHC